MPSVLPFSAAQKLTKSRAFSTLVKPVGSACNLRCDYCYYLGKASLYGGREPVMDDELLELYIRQYIEAVELPVVTFCWHGGEPLLAGLDFYRKAMQWQQQYKGDKQIENTLQTNGLLVDEAWCRFFHDHHFLVGLSLDGPRDLHDAYRRDKGGHPTFERVVRAAQLMAAGGVEFNILCTVNARSAGRGAEVYRFLRVLTPFIQFLPVVEYTNKEGSLVPPDVTNARPTPYSTCAADFGQFLCDVYDEWVRTDVGRIYVQLFDNTLAQWCGQPASLCALAETCGDGLAVEHNGDVYCCDHFVYPAYCLGNIRETPLAELYRKPERFHFGAAKFSALPRLCQRCRWLSLCHGGCPQHRYAEGRNSLCRGYKQFFAHTEADMRTMRTLLEKQLPPALIMKEKQPINIVL